MFTSEKMVKFLREKYPPGTRIRLVSMEDPYAPVAPGTEGTLVCVDDAGQFQMKWDNGRTLALIPGEDSFTVLPPEHSVLKLYMPLTAELYEPDEWGDMPEEAERLTGGELASYGRQKGWERERAATDSGNHAAEIPDGFVEITEQIELPF